MLLQFASIAADATPHLSPSPLPAGCSKGGTNSVIFASRHHDVPKVVNLAGRFRCRCRALPGARRGTARRG